MNTVPIFQVSEFNEVVNQHLSLLGEVTIEGELSRLDIKNGQLIFGSIKDKTSSLDIFSLTHIIKNTREFEEGMLVRVTGTAGLYKGSSKFRLFVKTMVPQGEGALQIAFEKLKLALEAEGLFAPERKRPLPEWPKSIGLITAPGSSAYHDLVKIISARMGGVTLKVLPVNVQGRQALPTLLKAFAYTNRHHQEFDVLIMARGGGSLEDLAAFNAEEVARAVFASKVPVISAIGHEDNWSLCDYVADVRASTPSNAAEMVVKDRREIIASANYMVKHCHAKLLQLLHQQYLWLDRQLLRVKAPMTGFTHRFNQLNDLITKSGIRAKNLVSMRQNQVENLERLLSSLNPQNVLKRGFSITKNSAGKIIKKVAEVHLNELITTTVSDGVVYSKVEKG